MRKIAGMNRLNKEELLELRKHDLDIERPVVFAEGKKLSDILYYRNEVRSDWFVILGEHAKGTELMITNVLVGHALLDEFDGSNVLLCIYRYHFKDGSIGNPVDRCGSAWVPAHWLRYRHAHRSLTGRLPIYKRSHMPL